MWWACTRSGILCVCSSHLAVLSTRRHAAHPVPCWFFILEIQARWSQNHDTEKPRCNAVKGEIVTHYNVVSLCRGFVTTELVSLWWRISADTGCAGCRRVEITVECKTHISMHIYTSTYMTYQVHDQHMTSFFLFEPKARSVGVKIYLFDTILAFRSSGDECLVQIKTKAFSRAEGDVRYIMSQRTDPNSGEGHFFSSRSTTCVYWCHMLLLPLLLLRLGCAFVCVVLRSELSRWRTPRTFSSRTSSMPVLEQVSVNTNPMGAQGCRIL